MNGHQFNIIRSIELVANICGEVNRPDTVSRLITAACQILGINYLHLQAAIGSKNPDVGQSLNCGLVLGSPVRTFRVTLSLGWKRCWSLTRYKRSSIDVFHRKLSENLIYVIDTPLQVDTALSARVLLWPSIDLRRVYVA